MSDDSDSPSRTERRERALAAARRRLRRLEIETHRIKAELARLEAENEDDIADELSGEFHDDAAAEAATRAVEGVAPASRVRRSNAAARDRVADEFASPRRRFRPAPGFAHRQTGDRSATGPRFQIDTKNEKASAAAGRRAFARNARRQSMPALWSLGLHAAVLLLCLPWTFAVLTNDNIALLASSLDLNVEPLDLNVEPLDDASEALLTLADDQKLPIEEITLEDAALDLSESLAHELMPLEDDSAAELAQSIGQLNSLPTDLGALMAGAGSGGDGSGGDSRRRGRLRATNFFGAEALGDRIVFLVDNSGSMKQGRLETTIYELLKSVDAMTDEQSFYVVFYSDQAYPMFYPNGVGQPVPATRENKQKLFDWLRTVELCIGGQLVNAMDLAATLRPDVVYILSDGDIASVRTLERLTEPNDWGFVIHTLGMGVKNAAHAANLSAIAQAHRGSFRMVQPTPAAVEMARRQPIRSNPSGVPWGMGSPQRLP